MNIAVCIAGQMRTYQYCAKSLHENLVEPYDADVFVDTWTQNDSSSKVNKVKIDLSDITEKKLNNAYNNLVRCNIDEFKSEYHDNLNGKKMPEKIKEFEPKYYKGDLPLFYKIYSCDLMRQEYDEDYDFVVRLRPDMILNEKVKSSLFEDKKLNHCSYAIGTSFQVSDKFAIGDSETMTYYSNLWEKLESYWDNAVDKYNSNKNRVGERMMYHHMCEAQDEYRVDSFGFSCYMLRSNLTPAVNF